MLSSSLIAGCAAEDDDLDVSTTMAPLVAADAAVKISNQYIVVFKGTTGDKSVSAAMKRVSLANRASRIDVQFDVIPGFSAQLAPDDLDAIRRDPNVAYVEEDQLMFATAIKPAAGQLDLDRHDHCPITDDNSFNDNTCNGSGVLVYIVDTGIRATHAQFGGLVINATAST